MCIIITVLTDDGHLGRLDYASLPDQALMEILVEGFSASAKKRYQDKHGMFLDVCQWERITCDADKNVISIEAHAGSGSISLDFIPPKVKDVYLNIADLSGTFSANALPSDLECLDIGINNFEGTVDFTALPAHMYYLSLCKNKFHGSAVLDSLPRGFLILWMQANSFSGSLNLENLPPNFFYLDASSNAFSGAFRILNVPENLNAIHASGNCFDEVALLPSHVCDVRLGKSGVTSVVDELGKPHPKQDLILAK